MIGPGVVEVRPVEGGYRVALVPPDPAWPDEVFECPKAARGAAGGIRLVTGRRKVDLTGQ